MTCGRTIVGGLVGLRFYFKGDRGFESSRQTQGLGSFRGLFTLETNLSRVGTSSLFPSLVWLLVVTVANGDSMFYKSE